MIASSAALEEQRLSVWGDEQDASGARGRHEFFASTLESFRRGDMSVNDFELFFCYQKPELDNHLLINLALSSCVRELFLRSFQIP